MRIIRWPPRPAAYARLVTLTAAMLAEGPLRNRASGNSASVKQLFQVRRAIQWPVKTPLLSVRPQRRSLLLSLYSTPAESFLITAAVIQHLWKLWLSVHSSLLTKENQLWQHLKYQDSTDAHPAKNATERIFLLIEVKIHWHCLLALGRQALTLALLPFSSFMQE